MELALSVHARHAGENRICVNSLAARGLPQPIWSLNWGVTILTTSKGQYGIASLSYLRRARARLDHATHETLFYAAFELRSGTESLLQDYVAARDAIAKHKKQGWKIMGSAKELDRMIRLGDEIAEACFLDETDRIVVAAYYTPITARLREAAGGRLHDLLHAMKKLPADNNKWWIDTRSFLEQIYSDLAFANKGTLLGPLMRSPDGKSLHMNLSIRDNSPLADKMHLFGKVGGTTRIRIRYLDALPEHATPFLNAIES